LLIGLSVGGVLASAHRGTAAGTICLRSLDDFAMGQQVTSHEVQGVARDSVALVRRRVTATLSATVNYEMSTCNCEHYALWVLTGRAARQNLHDPSQWTQAQCVWTCAACSIFCMLLFTFLCAAASPEAPILVVTAPATILGSAGLAAAFPHFVGLACSVGVGTPTVLAWAAPSMAAALGLSIASATTVGAGVGSTGMAAGGGTAAVLSAVAATSSGTVIVGTPAMAVAATTTSFSSAVAAGVAPGAAMAGAAGACSNHLLATADSGAQGKFDELLRHPVGLGPLEQHLLDTAFNFKDDPRKCPKDRAVERSTFLDFCCICPLSMMPCRWPLPSTL